MPGRHNLGLITRRSQVQILPLLKAKFFWGIELERPLPENRRVSANHCSTALFGVKSARNPRPCGTFAAMPIRTTTHVSTCSVSYAPFRQWKLICDLSEYELDCAKLSDTIKLNSQKEGAERGKAELNLNLT